ncbi:MULTISPECIES: hypothetical protein [unclassified Phormidesmis]
MAASTLFAIAAQAQDRPAVFRPREAVPDAVDRAFDVNVSDYRGPKFSVQTLIGTGAFPENAIARNGEHIHRLYRDLLTQQVSNDPIIRTTDLPNPYNTSILTLPTANVSNRVVGGELVFEGATGR